MPAADDRPSVPTENEVDAQEQQTPAVPDAQEDTGAEDPVQSHGDPLRADGSEADRLEQNADGGNADEDEYPRGNAG